MKNIKITVEVDGNEVSRKLSGGYDWDWEGVVRSMLDTLEKSNDPMK